MKIRFFSLIMVLCMLLSVALVACTGNTENVETTGNKNNETTEATDNGTNNTEDNATEETSAETEEAANGYTVIVVDANGNAVEGAEVQLCIVGGLCLMPQFTGADGIAFIEANDGEYHATIRIDGVVVFEYVPFPAGSKELTITLPGNETESTESAETESAEVESESETETN